MDTYVAILRGINVGGKRMIKMDALKQLFTSLGFQNVETYIQSGNVFFQCKKTSEEKLAATIAKEIENIFSFDVTTIVKNVDELQDIITNNPFTKDKKKLVEHFHVTFLATTPTKVNVDSIAKLTFGDDAFAIIDKTVYLYCPNSYRNSKLTNSFFETKLKVIATTRNWKTCNELVSIAEKISAIA
jgi:uncharacterized protein (DUF1697 family)